jgi:hypothetical protein
MTPQERLDRLAALRRMLEANNNQYDSLVARYSGVRPSWVSTDLSLLGQKIWRYKQEIKELEGDE